MLNLKSILLTTAIILMKKIHSWKMKNVTDQ